MKVLLLGDSHFVRKEGKNKPHIEWSLEVIHPSWTFQNVSISGATSGCLLKQLRKIELQSYDVVFVMVGSNDLATNQQISLPEFEENVKEILTYLNQSCLVEKICLIGPPPVDQDKQFYRTNRLVQSYEQRLRQIALEFGSDFISLVEVFESSQLPIEVLLEGSLDDGLHFGFQGYALLAQAMVDTVQSKK
ncbi:TPA: GDSL-type esterase/lipase family protein [Streptococcus suis]